MTQEMKLSNFKVIWQHGRNELDWFTRAEVDVTTGKLWWKKTVTRVIAKKYASSWYFADNGEFTPGQQAEALTRAWNAQDIPEGKKVK